MLYDPEQVTLAPLYDLLCTAAYPELSPRLAMKIAKAATLDDIGKDTWTAFAKDVGIGATFVRRRVRALAESVQATVFRVAEQTAIAGLDADALKKFASLIASRAKRLEKTA